MAKTLLIALDGATFTLFDDLMASGDMPFLKSLVASGTRAVLRSTDHPLTPPAFTTMTTGRSPGVHGIPDFIRRQDSGEQVFFTLYDARDNRCETIWAIANRYNRKATALNFVMTAPVQPVCGVVIPGMVHWKHLRRHVHPQRVYTRLKAQPWFKAKTMCWDFKHLEKAIATSTLKISHEEWVREHIEREEQWFRTFTHLMATEPTDLTSIVLDGVDKLQHLCWEFLDPAIFPAQPTEWQQSIRELCLEYYRKLDAFLAQAVELAGPEARVVLASDHGFGPAYVTFRLNQFLHEQGCLTWASGAREGDSFKEDGLEVDWATTRAYCPTASCKGILIRTRSEQVPQGVPPEEYAAFRDGLVKALREIINPRTDKPLVRKVMLREEIYAGPAMNDCPDITIMLDDCGFVSTAPGNELLEIKPDIKGTHYPDGIFIAAGADIRAGATLEPLEMTDVAPTLLYSLDVPVPENFEGRVVTELFTDAALTACPPEQGEPAAERVDDTQAVGADAAPEPSAEENEAIYAQLKALGYME